MVLGATAPLFFFKEGDNMKTSFNFKGKNRSLLIKYVKGFNGLLLFKEKKCNVIIIETGKRTTRQTSSGVTYDVWNYKSHVIRVL